MDQEEVIGRFVKRVARKFKPQAILLFGSRARGDALVHSDYDFIIISEQFRGMHWLDRISAIAGLWDSYEGIDIVPYTPEQFKERRSNSITIRDAIKYAKVVYGQVPDSQSQRQRKAA